MGEGVCINNNTCACMQKHTHAMQACSPPPLMSARLPRTHTSVSLEASALRVSLLLELLPEGRGHAVVVTGVLEGSEADKVGG